jgi:protease-4
VTIEGLIRGDQERVQQLDRLGRSSTARAVIVHVDSPGGTTAGSEQLYDSLMRLKEKKPLVIVVDSMAASGGYITALAGDHIVAQQTSLVGSIGVLFQYPNVADLLTRSASRSSRSNRRRSRRRRTASSRPARKRARRSNRSSRIPTPGSAAWCRIAGISATTSCNRRRRPGVHRPSGDRPQADRRARRRADRLAWLGKEKNVDAKLPVRDYQLHEPLQRPAVPARRRRGAARRRGLSGAGAPDLDEWGAC